MLLSKNTKSGSYVLCLFVEIIFLYFFVTKKNEPLLCEEFANQVKETLKIPIYGIINTFIKKRRPILAKPGSRLIRYYIDDNFLNFWFCFIYKNRSSLEISNYKLVKEIVRRDFDTYSGRFLEKYFIEKLAASNEYSKIGNYWEKGNQNEIDIVAVDKRNLKVLFAEVKMNKTNINLNKLQQKSTHLTEKFQGYHFEYKGFSIDDM